jgi:peptidoglycan hydrolase-like protein with peptidoglycan-binding domain
VQDQQHKSGGTFLPLLHEMKEPIVKTSSLNRLSFAAITVCLTTSALHADTAGGLFAARGTGAQSCIAVTEAFKISAQGARNEIATWLSGYVSYMNRSTPGYFDVLPIQDTGNFAIVLNAVCQQNPDNLVEGAVWSIVEALRPLASKDETELLQLQNENGGLSIRMGTLKIVQDFLVFEGFLEERQADGKFGPNTSRALSQFQMANNIEPTGLPEAFTLLAVAQKLQ